MSVFNPLLQSEQESFIPYKLRPGSTLDLNLLELPINAKANTGLTPFISFEQFIKNASIYDIFGNKMANIYFEESRGSTSFLRADTNDIKSTIPTIDSCQLFTIYDKVFPHTKSEWNDWLGNDSGISGILEDLVFIIQKNAEDVVKDFTTRNILSNYPEFSLWNECFIETYENDEFIIKTNIVSVVQAFSKCSKDEVFQNITDGLDSLSWCNSFSMIDDEWLEIIINNDLVNENGEIIFEFEKFSNNVFQEKVFSTSSGGTTEKIQTKVLMYKRLVRDYTEYLSISIKETPSQAYIEIAIGVDIEINNL